MNAYKQLSAFLIVVLSFAVFSLAAHAASSSSTALPIIVESVEIDDSEMELSAWNTLAVERGQEVEVVIRLTSEVDVDDVQVEAALYGFEYDAYEPDYERSRVFDMDANVTYKKTLKLTLSGDFEEDEYILAVRVQSRMGSVYPYEYKLKIDVPRRSLQIKDVVFNPENQVVAGRALLTSLRIENDGEKDLNGVKVEVAIPDLGISASDWVDEVDADPANNDDNEVTTEELYLRIPQCAVPGKYSVRVTATYDNGYEKATEQSYIEVLASEDCPRNGQTTTPEVPSEKTLISLPSETENVVAGGNGALFPVTITNAGSKSVTYMVSTQGGEGWATFKVTQSTFILNSGETKTAYVYVSALPSTESGERMFSVTISGDGKELKQIPLTVVVEEATPVDGSKWSSVQKGLIIAVIVLVVLLVILLLVIGFSRLKGSSNDEGKDEEASGQSYY